VSAIAIRVEGLSKEYTIGGRKSSYRTLRETITDTMKSVAMAPVNLVRGRRTSEPAERFLALRDVSFTVKRGEVVGVIGRNGAGKSTLLKVLSRITEPSEGYADIHGRVGSLLEVGTGFHPELTGRENIFLNGAILGMKRSDIERQFDAIVAFSEVEKFVDTPVKHYSSGMYLRLAFAVAAHLDPEILLVDEVLAVGDMAFQKKCMGKMDEVARQGRTVLFVSHNMGAVRSLCEKGIVLDKGTVVHEGAIGPSIEAYYRLAAAAEKADSANGRVGFGAIALTSHPSSTIQQSDRFSVSTTLALPERVAGFRLICVLEDMHQRVVFHLQRNSHEFRAGGWEGTHAISLDLPALWLEPGLYTLYFKAFPWGDVAQARIVSDVFRLDVAGDSSGTGAALVPHSEWRIKPAD